MKNRIEIFSAENETVQTDIVIAESDLILAKSDLIY